MEASSALFFTSIFSAIPHILEINNIAKTTRDKVEFMRWGSQVEEFYDYIIVGGGSAGSLLANRLSRNPRHQVLLLEKGGDPDPIQDVPFNAAMQVTPVTDYGYHTIRQENAFLSTGNVAHAIRGRGLGGSGNMNHMVFQRGAGKGYDEWAELADDPRWRWENVLPFFKKFENYRGHHQPIDRRYHSNRGELFVSSPLYKPSASYFLAACKELGINLGDLNTGVQTAPIFDTLEYKIKKGKRFGPFQAFLQPVMTRPNLCIYRYAQVVKVNVDGNKRATGVVYQRHGMTRRVNARKEIILSAGSFDSPKILLLSGIGPKEDLELLNIPVIQDLPVGKNHQDHIGAVIDTIQFDAPIAFDPVRDITPKIFKEYEMRGIGPLSIPGAFFGIGYISTSFNVQPEIPDVQLFFTGSYCYKNPFCFPGFEDSLMNITREPDSNTFAVILGTPYSEGELKLKSSNPQDDILIDPKYFSNSTDIQRIIEGIKFGLSLYENTTVYSRVGAKLVLRNLPEACDTLEFRSDAFWECYIQQVTAVIYHPVGGCRMGKADDPRSVVDSKLKVIGVSGLRVVDGSIMPRHVNSNPQTPIYMIAEVAAQLITEDY